MLSICIFCCWKCYVIIFMHSLCDIKVFFYGSLCVICKFDGITISKNVNSAFLTMVLLVPFSFLQEWKATWNFLPSELDHYVNNQSFHPPEKRVAQCCPADEIDYCFSETVCCWIYNYLSCSGIKLPRQGKNV